MLIRFFKTYNASALLFLPLIALLMWAVAFFSPVIVNTNHTMPLYKLIGDNLNNIPLLSSIIGFLLLIGEAFLLNFIINDNDILNKKNYLPALFYIVFMSSNNEMLYLHPILLGNLFVLFAINTLLNSYRKENAFSNAFNAGFLISTASLFYLPFIVFIPLLGVAFIAMRTFNWREWIISGFGILIPYLFIFSFYFWFDNLDWLIIDNILYSFVIDDPKSFEPTKLMYFIICFGWFLIVTSISRVLLVAGSGSQKSKRSNALFLAAFLLSILFITITREFQTSYFSAFAIPASVFCANYFSNIKRQWIAELFFMTILVGIFILLWS